MVETLSSEKPAAVLVEHVGGTSEIWLRKNIEEDAADNADGTEVSFWRADEEHLAWPAYVDASDVEADFDTWWAKAEDADKTDEERAAELKEWLAIHDDAIAELATIMAEL